MSHNVDQTTRRWHLQLVALALGTFGIGTSEFVIVGVLPALSSFFSVSESLTGYLVTAYAVGVAVGAPTLIVLLVRVSRVTALYLLLGLFVVAHLVAAFAPSFTVLLVARFLSGLPHGAYFGIATVVAARIAPPNRQGAAVSVVLAGIAVANIGGVPLGTWIGQVSGWRATFMGITVVGCLAALALFATMNRELSGEPPELRAELRGLLNRGSGVTLAVITIGFSGLFLLYAYIALLLTDAAGFPPSSIPWLLLVVGTGFTTGSLWGGRLTDRNLPATLVGGLLLLATSLGMLSVGVISPALTIMLLFFLGVFAFGSQPPISKRLIDQAPHAPTLVTATSQSAFNVANAVGAAVGSLALSGGIQVQFLGLMGAAVVLTGAGIAIVSLINDSRGSHGGTGWGRSTSGNRRDCSQDEPAA